MSNAFALNEVTHFEDKEAGPSERKFGLVVGGIFCLISALKYFHNHGNYVTPVLGTLGAILFILGLLKPSLLRAPNILWNQLGSVLHNITNPIVLGFLYYLCIMPIGLLLKFAKRDILSLRIEKGRKSYWIERSPQSPESQSMKLQF